MPHCAGKGLKHCPFINDVRKYVAEIHQQINDTLPILKKSFLTATEVQICKLLITGIPIKQLSQKMYISSNTTKAHIRNIRKKCGITNKSIQLKNYLVGEHFKEIIGSKK